MKLQYIKIILLPMCITLGLSSCKKLIEIDPPISTISTSAAFGNNAKANAIITGMYSEMMNNSGLMAFANGAEAVYGGLSSDELVNYLGTSDVFNYQYYTNTINPSTNTVADVAIWNAAYKVIYSANAAIINLTPTLSPNVDDSLRNNYTGEAKFIRAYSYFYLTNFYGDVPLPLTTDFNKTSLLPRTAQIEVYNLIVQDLKDAQSLLPANYNAGSGERIRANKMVATALLAKVYLYQKNWKAAQEQASAVIGDNEFSLTNNLSDVFLKNSSEAIWQLQSNITSAPYNATFEGMNLCAPAYWYDLPVADQQADLDPGLYSFISFYFLPQFYLSDQLIGAFEKNDQRQQQWVRSTPSPKAAPYNGYNYSYSYKYTVQIGVSGVPATQYYMMLRLGEQYLIRAEAEAEQGNTGAAATDVNRIRARAGLPATTAGGQDGLLSAIAHERQVELFAENANRWFDLKRTGQATAVLGAIKEKQPFNATQLLYPIPNSELIRDPNLIQNTGY